MSVDLVREFPPAAMETTAGTVHVHVRGAEMHTSWLHIYRLRPVEVVVTRADGRVDRAAVTDPGGRVAARLITAGASVAALSWLIRRRLAR